MEKESESLTLEAKFTCCSQWNETYKNAVYANGCLYYSLGFRVFKIHEGRHVIWREFKHEIEFFAFSKDKNRYFVSFRDGTQYVCHVGTHEQVALAQHDSMVIHMVEYGECEVISISKAEIKRYNQFTGKLVLTYSPPDWLDYNGRFSYPVLESRKDRLLLCCFWCVWVFCNRTGKEAEMKRLDDLRAPSLAVIDKETLAFIGEKKSYLYNHVRDIVKAELDWEYSLRYMAIAAPDCRHILFGGDDCDRLTHLFVFDTQTRRIKAKILTNAGDITSIAISENGEYACVTGYKGTRLLSRIDIIKITPALKKY